MSTLWRFVVAAAFILLGLFAIIEPTVAGLAAAVLVGWLLLFSGVAHVVGAFFLERHGWSRLWTVLLGVLYVIGGAYFVTHPLMGLGTLTLLLAAILIMEAVVRLMIYMRLRREGASGWLVVNAVITLLLGVMIWSQWPASAIWAIGMMMGVNLLMSGLLRLMPSVLRPIGTRPFS